MKKFLRALSVMITMIMIIAVMPVTAMASSFSDAKNGVVLIVSNFTAPDDRTYIFKNEKTGRYGWLLKDNTVSLRGSGFAIGKENEPVQYIVTNAHVVLDETAVGIKSLDPLQAGVNISSKKANEVLVYFSYGANEFMRAQIYLLDEEKDICVLKLPQTTDKRNPLTICKSTDINMDDDFAALGFPSDSDRFVESTAQKFDVDDITMTRGAISRQTTDAKGRNVYQIDVDISPGNSGGPLVNSKGEVVGINTYYVPTSDGNKVNYAITIDELLAFVNRDMVPYTLSTEVSANPSGGEGESSAADPGSKPTTPPEEEKSDNTVMIIIIAAAAVVVIVVVAVIIVSKKKKSAGSNQQIQSSTPVQTPSRGAVITGVKGIMSNRDFPVNGSVIIGRNSQKCNICFPVDTKGISGTHCQIRQASRGYEIVDLGSSNGTFLGSGQRLTPDVPVIIPDGTYFYLGSAEQLFQIRY